jgi:dTDP-4-amino-4,6-dideoxygalactose transaminase
MAEGIYKITEQFEQELCKYTGAPFAVAVDSCSNALFLSLKYENIEGKIITIPSCTYLSVPCEIIHAGGKVNFIPFNGNTSLKGAYRLKPTRVWDSALTFNYNMYIHNTFMCLSFTGPYKHLKLIKGGAILTDDEEAYVWFKRSRVSGRREVSYFKDNFDMLGYNCYMLPEVAARGILLMKQFYDQYEKPLMTEDVELPYPDLSKFPIYQGEKK